MSADVIPIRASMNRAPTAAAPASVGERVAELELAAARALAALYRLRSSNPSLVEAAIDFSRLETIESVRLGALALNVAIDEQLAGKATP